MLNATICVELRDKTICICQRLAFAVIMGAMIEGIDAGKGGSIIRKCRSILLVIDSY
jgi:hypothetical protein